ncbi:MAG: YihY/virulence factor BrkB family protein [Coriobacteriia bacterium]|nr:YihY/virulence factor BrkB family protein [Coriobacteriia bacterium]MBN2847565.1 YihY/virulence factor BrkB family protein [Coriobacteriia bacterium]
MSAPREPVKRFIRAVEGVLGDAAKGWADHGAPQIAAALSYYALLSVAPLLLVVVTIAGRFVSTRAATAELLTAADRLAGELGTSIVEELLASASLPSTGTLLSGIAVVLAIFGAMRLFGAMRSAFDRIWDTPPERAEGTSFWDGVRFTLRAFAVHNLRAFLMVIVVGVLLIATLALNALAVAITSEWIGVDLSARTVQALDILISLIVLWALFAAVYLVLPRLRLGWSDVAVGAAMTAGLFTFGRWLLGLYLSSSSIGTAFGAAGSVVVFLVWLNYSAQIVLLGAEMTRAWTYRFGSKAATETAGDA